MGAGRILRMKASVSIPPGTLYSTLAQPPLSTHSRYSFRRQEATERKGGSSLPAADGMAVRHLALLCRLPQEVLLLSSFFAPTCTSPTRER